MSASDYPKHCEGCKMTITAHTNHFSDVPGVGDLCNPCHKEWAEEVEIIMAKEKKDGRKP